ncbi:hypothetical protein ACX12M_03420 [Cellulosimicrobium cellulans]|uniref:Uncharacterized protein n=1 Tax=Cellulosimicrobium funkei TaxID=264251 RepID=A0A4Y8QXB0_9MICO|nr:hypothetical protein [Cellulosimicrobium funkei]TFF04180.1 hypothetical protein E1O70_19005 [Cellulosimicrobium funkei]TGA67607.1 hypothetical protein EQW79_019000 [Cellulosimicrobium terreum]
MTRSPAPEAPGRLGEAIPAADLLAYLGALETWLDERRTELDRLDAAAQAAATPDAYTADLVLALSLWQAIRSRADEIRPVWDSGRADAVAREKISQLLWGRLDSGSGAALVSLVEAVKLCDALVVQLRTRLSFDPHTADQVARLRGVRAELVRCEDLAGSDADARGRVETLRGRLDHLVAQAARGADVSGPLAELETEVARAERDLIVASAQRRELRRDRARTEEQRAALEAREPALRELVARCRREIAHPPRLAVPDVSRLGPVPDSRFELDAYAARLATVARAVETVEDAYTRPLRARAELRYSLERLAARADVNGRSASPTVRSGLAEAREAVETTPCDVTLARFLVEQYQFLTRDLPTPEGASS